VTLEKDGEMRGKIEALEHLGPRAYLHARLAGGTMLVVQTGGDTPVRIGDQVAFRVHSAATHLFGASGKALTRSGSKPGQSSQAWSEGQAREERS